MELPKTKVKASRKSPKNMIIYENNLKKYENSMEKYKKCKPKSQKIM